MTMERRQFLGLSLGAVLSTVHSRALAEMLQSGDLPDGPMMDWPAYAERGGASFSDPQRQTVTAMVDLILPRTDTPGAVDAGVPNFIELIYGDWMTSEERTAFLSGLAEVEALSEGQNGAPFTVAEADDRIAVLEGLEDAAKDHPWYQLGGPAAYESEAPFIALFKELTVVGFFMSELGSTEVLRFNHFPGYFEGDIALDPDESSWAPGPLV